MPGPKPMVVFVGSAQERDPQGLASVYHAYASTERHHHDVAYFTHDAQAAIVAHVRGRAGPLCLVGHGWGGDTVLGVANQARDRRIDLIVTLDPIAFRRAWTSVPMSVGKWHNVRVAAQPGASGHFGPRPRADRDVDLAGRTHHGDARTMFNQIWADVAQVGRRNFFR